MKREKLIEWDFAAAPGETIHERYDDLRRIVDEHRQLHGWQTTTVRACPETLTRLRLGEGFVRDEDHKMPLYWALVHDAADEGDLLWVEIKNCIGFPPK